MQADDTHRETSESHSSSSDLKLQDARPLFFYRLKERRGFLVWGEETEAVPDNREFKIITETLGVVL